MLGMNIPLKTVNPIVTLTRKRRQAVKGPIFYLKTVKAVSYTHLIGLPQSTSPPLLTHLVSRLNDEARGEHITEKRNECAKIMLTSK